ncbi:N-terminal acetyltransferase [Loxospora ochrophaea]|nr:N-terminal acetyltransferase [Loxospora ochrophaea]
MAALDISQAAYHETYTPEQLELYYDRIKLPAAARKSPVTTSPDAAKADEGLEFLKVLLKYQLAAIPWENIELHYSTHHSISLQPQHLFHKMIERGTGRGGYCMENNCLFGTVLRSLGYDVLSGGARINEAIEPVSGTPTWKGPKFNGWNHMINIITISSKKYLIDVGIGSMGPTFPLPLIADTIFPNTPPQDCLLSYTPTRQHTTSPSAPDQSMWIYSHRHATDKPWIPTYCFTEMEFFPEDFEVMSFYTSAHRTCWLTRILVCVKWDMDEATGELVGDTTLAGPQFKRRRGGVSEELAMCASEEQRVKAFEEFFGIRLSQAERSGIKGYASEIC